MDLLLILGSTCAVVAFLFTVWMLVIGAVAARPPQWQLEFQRIASIEAQSRGLLQRPRSENDEQALQRFVGTTPAEVDSQLEEMTIKALLSVTDASPQNLEALHSRRTDYLNRALERQLSITQRFNNSNIAAKVWNGVYFLNSAIIVWHGLRWFFPLFFSKTRRIGEKYLSTATFLGVWAGLLWWASTHFNKANAETDWLGLVGVVITLSTVLGLIVAIGKQFWTLLTGLKGPRTEWTLKGTVVGAVSVCVFAAWMVLMYTGTFTEWSLTASKWGMRQLDQLGWSEAMGAILMIAILLYLIRNGIQRIRLKSLRAEDRIGFAFVTAVLIVVTYFVAVYATHAPHEYFEAGMWIFGVLFIAGGIVLGTLELVEISRDLRFARASKDAIPRKGFRWWMLLAWTGLSASGIVASLPVAPTLTPYLEPMLSILQISGLLSLMVAYLIWIPGMIVSVLYIRRIRKARRLAGVQTVTPEVARETVPATASEAIALGYIALMEDQAREEGRDRKLMTPGSGERE